VSKIFQRESEPREEESLKKDGNLKKLFVKNKSPDALIVVSFLFPAFFLT
jgi:hypothetical protein